MPTYGSGKPANGRRKGTATTMLLRDLPPALLEALHAYAERDRRTLNNEVIWILEDWVESHHINDRGR